MKKIFVIVIVPFILLSSKPIAYGYGWGYKQNESHTVPEIGKYGEIIKGQLAFYADLHAEKEIYLTFDNGYEQGYTEKVLTILQKHEVPATFFVTGHYVKSVPHIINRMVSEGHIIGNHSYNHPDFTTLSKEKIKEELELLEQAVKEVSKQKEMLYLRPPRGTFNEQTLQWAKELGYVHLFWSIAFKDWETDRQKGWKYAYDQVMKQVHPGAIILLHTVSQDNADALDKIITDLKEQGYQFKSLDDLMAKHYIQKNDWLF